MKKRIRLCIMTCILLAAFLSGCAGTDSGKSAGADPDSREQIKAGAGTKEDTEQNTGVPADAPAGTAASDGRIVFEAQNIEGDAVSSDIFPDSRLTMINVWATYCGPCLNEMPELGELAAEYDPADFQLIGIISDVVEGADSDQTSLAADLIGQTGAAYPHLLINESLYYALLTDVSAVPTTFFIDENGMLLKTVIGAQDKETWKEIIDGLLEE